MGIRESKVKYSESMKYMFKINNFNWADAKKAARKLLRFFFGALVSAVWFGTVHANCIWKKISFLNKKTFQTFDRILLFKWIETACSPNQFNSCSLLTFTKSLWYSKLSAKGNTSRIKPTNFNKSPNHQ